MKLWTGKTHVNLSWAQLLTMTKPQREHSILMAEQEALAKEHAEIIKAAKAKRKAEHIARMQEVARLKKRR